MSYIIENLKQIYPNEVSEKTYKKFIEITKKD